MRHERLKACLFALIGTLVYSLDTWSLPPKSQPQSKLALQGRAIHFDEQLTKAARQNLLNDINVLISKGSPDLRGINLEELKNRSQKIVVAVAEGEPFVGSGYRNGAINLTEQEAFIFSYGKLKKYTSTQKVLIQWHEALGAMGYNDDNYLISTQLVQKITTPNSSIHPQILKRLNLQFNEPKINHNKVWREQDGGATGVGGGGDGDIAEIKWALLSYVSLLASDNAWGTPEKASKLIDLAIETPIESIEFKSKYRIYAQFRELKIGLNLINARPTILVDTEGWKSMPQGVVGEMNTKVLTHITLVLETILDMGGLH